MKYQYFIAFFLLAILTTFGQVTGKIIDVDTQEPLEYATAAIFKQANKELVTGVITDINGVFTISNLKKGTYYLEVSFLGYETKTIENIVIENSRTKKVGTLGLRIGGNELDEVVVKANRATVINKIDRQVYDAKVFQNSQGGSATDVIKNLPSVSVNGLGDISVRGTTGFVALLNGKPVQGNAATILNQLPANAVERVELITAPSAKYDPEGKGGILNIITKKGAINGTYTQVNVKGGFPSIEDYDNGEAAQRYGADITYNVRSDTWNVSLGASYQRNDVTGRREGDVYTIIGDTFTRFPSDGERSYDETNYSGRFTLDYTPDTKNEFSLGFFAGKRSKDRRADILYYDNHSITPVNGTTRDYTFQYYNENLRIRKGDFVLGSLDYKHTFTNKSKLSSSLLYEYTLLGGPTTNRNLAYPNTQVILQDEFNTNDNPLYGIRAQVDYSFVPFSFGNIETGYQYRNLDHKGDFVYERRNNTTQEFELVPEFSSQVDLTRTIHSGYVQLNGKKSKWDYAAGVRIEAMDRVLDLKDKTQTVDTTYSYNYTKLFPSASLQYSINDATKLKIAYSKRVERTASFKLNPFREREHSETLEQGDPTLRPEFIDLVELGITKKYKNGNSVYATAYYRDVKNLVNRVNQVFNDTILDRIYSNVGKAHVTGIELGTQFKATENWSNFIGGNIYNYTIDGSYDGRNVDSDATIFSVNANSTYTFNDTASLQFTVNYLSNRKTAQGEDSEFYLPNLTFRKTFLDNKLVATLQWQNMDMGLLNTNEQRITTSREGEFFTTTNYVLEVDRVILNLSYSFNKNKNRSKFIESEFGKREF
ncbi:outer membrane receptor for ferrienterochelin and colicin [Maribacter vaceletii]|uniref:Outer membrane receptor for ferrienterochelin and colicin n=1 Tax=Maribacter vaceletii TaxID=1206816 RepID=A0A495E7C8_9FLAO|nr:TonB-dependent receptor [Maribacter vaceletii]RKR12479.1 outer membrane receptor for ferrienterochelin and colicin [Maribacter vaceletii]